MTDMMSVILMTGRIKELEETLKLVIQRRKDSIVKQIQELESELSAIRKFEEESNGSTEE